MASCNFPDAKDLGVVLQGRRILRLVIASPIVFQYSMIGYHRDRLGIVAERKRGQIVRSFEFGQAGRKNHIKGSLGLYYRMAER